jgi:hypothetical protein
MEQHRAPALGHQRHAGSPCIGGAAEFSDTAVHGERSGIGLQLAEQDAGQLLLSASHESIHAQNFAGARLQGDVPQAAAQRELIDLQYDGAVARVREHEVVRIAVLERLAALADHRFDQRALAG